VDDHNSQRLNKIKSPLHSIQLVGDYPKNYKPTISTYGTMDDINLCNVLKIKKGARVMIVLNIDTADSLVNGSMGIVLDIVTNPDG
jgi:hypothetical protein